MRVGVSAGLAIYPDDGRTAALLLQAADASMYAAKRTQKSRGRARPEIVETALAASAG